MAKHRMTPFRFLVIFTNFMFNVFAGVSLQWALRTVTEALEKERGA